MSLPPRARRGPARGVRLRCTMSSSDRAPPFDRLDWMDNALSLRARPRDRPVGLAPFVAWPRSSLVADQVTKALHARGSPRARRGRHRRVCCAISHVENSGAAFGMFQGAGTFLLVATVIGVIAISCTCWRFPPAAAAYPSRSRWSSAVRSATSSTASLEAPSPTSSTRRTTRRSTSRTRPIVVGVTTLLVAVVRTARATEAGAVATTERDRRRRSSPRSPRREASRPAGRRGVAELSRARARRLIEQGDVAARGRRADARLALAVDRATAIEVDAAARRAADADTLRESR